MSYLCAGKSFRSLNDAKVFAELIFKSKGIVAAIEKKPSKAARRLIEARLQNAVNGFQIPMMSIPKLYRAMEAAVAVGASDEDLKTVVAGFPGVKEGASY